MTLRFEGIARIGFFTLIVLASCSESDTNPGGSGGGSGGSAAGAAATSGTSGTGTAGSMAGSGTAGSAAGSTAAGSNAGGSGGSGGSGAGGSGAGGSAAGTGGGGGSGGAKSKTTFFVTSDTVTSGKMGGLDGADMRCTNLAKASGFGDHTWKAYLSTATVNAKDRIGTGPWVNANGVTVAENVAALLAMNGNADLFIDEKGMKINGQWEDSPGPNQHDILTGTKVDGTVATGLTCMDWTTDANTSMAQVGHSDGLGPNGSMDAMYRSWSTTHTNQGCGNLTPGGGAGKIYCFASD
jgi:hypothetical protein